jgi:hypothetical protein
MRVFVTGATGWVGWAVVNDLIAAGHQVPLSFRQEGGGHGCGRRRSPSRIASGPGQPQAGRRPVRRRYPAFNHDFSKFAENCNDDRRAIETLGGVLEGSDRPLLVTWGLGFAPGRIGTEDDPPMPTSDAYPRASEDPMG